MREAALKEALDTVLEYTTGRAGGAPGVVAMVTNRDGNIYEGAAGVRELGRDREMTTDTVFAIFSCTKAIAGAALMQLVEEGAVGLDDPVGKYVPEIDDIQVLGGFAEDGSPQLRAPRTQPTVGQLMLHTAGFGYEIFSQEDLRYRQERGIPTVVDCTFESVQSVLLFDPGERWNYGVNIDWVGKVVEAARGKRLGEVLRERIFDPLRMADIGFEMTPSMADRRATFHQRDQDGKLTPQPDLVLPQPPPMDMAGHGLYASLGEYTKFIRMILNDGAAPDGTQVLQPATVQRMASNGLGELRSGGWVTSIPSLANAGEFFPGVEKSWGYTWQINEEPLTTGRPAGQLMWAGLSNMYFWIDQQNGIGGIWGSQILPFQDCASYPGFVDLETQVYRHLD